MLSEISPIGVFIALAFLSWSYNWMLMAKVIVVSFGLSLAIRAFMPKLSTDRRCRNSFVTVLAGASQVRP